MDGRLIGFAVEILEIFHFRGKNRLLLFDVSDFLFLFFSFLFDINFFFSDLDTFVIYIYRKNVLLLMVCFNSYRFGKRKWEI